MADPTQDAINALDTEVTNTEGVEESAKVLIESFAAQILAAKDDPAQIAALAARMRASADRLSAAVAANPGT